MAKPSASMTQLLFNSEEKSDPIRDFKYLYNFGFCDQEQCQCNT